MAQLAQHSSREGPPWLHKFLECSYFDPCKTHVFSKNEKNRFCVDCIDGPLCSRGLSDAHFKHRTLQVRKASYAVGIRVENVCKLLDISGIQTYTINNHKIVFLLRQLKEKQRGKQGDRAAHNPRHCLTCYRELLDLVKFCSIRCKLHGIQHKEDISITLSLTPEVRSAPLRGLHQSLSSLEPVPSSCTASPNLSEPPVDMEAFDNPHRKRDVNIVSLSTSSQDYDALRMSSLVSPTSVLHSLLPRTFDNTVSLPTTAEGRESVRVCTKSIAGSERPYDLDQQDQCAMQQDGKMSEMMLVRNVSPFSFRRRKRKSTPHRAPLM